tara:strand:+ start:10289 stop:11608 length:1320 start_codon:yes stop_codon:yes gene_type:complete
MQSLGKKLYKKAKKIIPGGNQLLSKRPEMFLPDQWPSYYKKASGIEIWDLNNKIFKDFSIMSIGQCSLGYANKKVDQAVIKAIKNGSTSTLNSYEEVNLADQLLNIHKGLDMARFAKTGGEACSIAVRIARAATGRSKIIASGYFGWQDWYLAANLANNTNLDKLLLPGLQSSGVPKELSGTTLTVLNGDSKRLEELFNENNDIAGVIVEVQRNRKPNLEFLKLARKLCNKHKSVLIFDEVSSGFRLRVGGLYKNYNLKPDILTLGKALGNGYPISAILGKKEVMENAQNSFISSSYWTERLGFVAGLATIKEYQRFKADKYLIKIGRYFDKKFFKLIKELKLPFQNNGLISVPIISFNSGNQDMDLKIKTYLTQEMLKKGYIFSNVIYLSINHNKKNIDKFFYDLHSILKKNYNNFSSKFFSKNIKGPICHSGFRRLT